MSTTSLVRAVERFAGVTYAATGSELERAWAWGDYDSEGVRFAFFRTYEELRDLATRTAAARAARGLAISQAQRILAQYQGAYRDLQAALLGVAAGEEDQSPAQGEWSLREIVAHIVGAEVGFYVVVKYALDWYRSSGERPQPLAPKIPDEAWEVILGEDIASIEAVLDGPLAGIQSYYENLHERILFEFAGIADDELGPSSHYWEEYPLPLRFRLHRFDSHLRQHTVQVDKTLAAIGRVPNEARRLLRLVYAALAEAEGAAIGVWEVAEELWDEAAEMISERTDEVAEILA